MGIQFRRERDAKALLCLLFVACAVGYTAWYILRHHDFSNDDLDNFLLARRSGFLEYVLTPTDVHFVPLHRLLSWVVYYAAPMDFSLAVAVLMAFHVGALVYLYLTLRLLGARDAGKLLACVYSASALIVFGLIWWAHAQHRAPYVLLDLCAVYHYLAWLRSKKPLHLAIAAGAFVLAFGAYEKAVFIPVHMFLIGWLANRGAFHPRPWKAAALPALLLCVAGVYTLLYFHFQPIGKLDAVEQLRAVQANIDYQKMDGASVAKLEEMSRMSPAKLRLSFLKASARSELEFLKVIAGASIGLSIDGVRDIPFNGYSKRLMMILLLYGSLYAFSLWRIPGCVWIMVSLPLILLLDFLPIALSTRGTFFGETLTTHQYRFYYEEWHLVVLFAGLWCRQLYAAFPSLTSNRITWHVAFALVLAYGALNISNLRASAKTQWTDLWFMESSHGYMNNLRESLKKITEPNPSFQNSNVPGYMSFFKHVTETRVLVPLFRPDARFDSTPARYTVDDAGNVLTISPSPPPPYGGSPN